MKKISTNTNVHRKLEAAIWWRRLLGYFIDIFLVALTLPIALLTIDSVINLGITIDSIINIIFPLLYVLYCIIFEAALSRTIGKMITGTIVVNNKTYGKPSFDQILGRSFSRLIPFEVVSFISKRPQGWHDIIPGTKVVSIKSLKEFKFKA